MSTFQQNELVSRCWSSPLLLYCGPVLLILSFVLGKHYWCCHNRITRHVRTSWQNMASGEKVRPVGSEELFLGCGLWTQKLAWIRAAELCKTWCLSPKVKFKKLLILWSPAWRHHVYHSLKETMAAVWRTEYNPLEWGLVSDKLNKTSETKDKKTRVQEDVPDIKWIWMRQNDQRRRWKRRSKVEAQNWIKMEWEV